MKQPKFLYPIVLLMGAMLIIALALSLIYLLDRLQEQQEAALHHTEPDVVGAEAEPGPDGWRTLFNGVNLDGWEITNFGPQGPVVVTDSSVMLVIGDGCTGITWTKEFPSSDYEVSLEARRIDGNDFFCGLTFPVFDEHCTFIVGGWGGSLVGLSSIDGLDASENFTTTRMSFENDRWYSILIRVDSKFISGYIDDELMVQAAVTDHSFSVRPEVSLSRPLGVASWMTTAAIRNIKYREIKKTPG